MGAMPLRANARPTCPGRAPASPVDPEFSVQSNLATPAAPAHLEHELLRNRNRAVARSFFRQLRGEGFTHNQIIELSSALLELVSEDIRQVPPETR